MTARKNAHRKFGENHTISLAGITRSNPDTLGGMLVFTGMRVSVRSLYDYLESGDTLKEFLHQFPSVKREQAVAVLNAAYASVAADAHPA